MGWKTQTLTTAVSTGKVTFAGRGSIYAEGTFGSGTLEIHPISANVDGGAQTVSTGSLYNIDGSTVKSADVPSGLYQLSLTGSAGATVVVWYNDQYEFGIQR